MRTPSPNQRSQRRTPLRLLLALLAVLPLAPGIPVPAHSIALDHASLAATISAPPPPPAPALSAAIDVPSAGPWTGGPLNLSAQTSGGSGPPLTYRWNDSLGTLGVDPVLELSALGLSPIEVTLTVTDSTNQSAVATAAFAVGNGPIVEVAGPSGTTDLGRSVPFTVTVSRDASLSVVNWSAGGGSGTTVELLNATSELILRAPADQLGELNASVRVDSLLSGTISVSGPVGEIVPDPVVELATENTTVIAGSVVAIEGTVDGGTAPFAWQGSANRSYEGAGAPPDPLAGTGPVEWSGRFLQVGPARVTLVVIDSQGETATANLSLEVVAGLSAVLFLPTGTPSAGEPLNVTIVLGGGIPPYRCSLNLSDGESGTLTARAPGAYAWAAHPARSGPLEVVATVTDARSESTTLVALVELNGSIPLPEAPSPAPAPKGGGGALSAHGSDAALLAAAAVVGILALAVFAWRRSTRGPLASAPPDPAQELVARLVRESDGLERLSLVALAEDDGLTVGEVDQALGALASSGRVRIEGSGGATDRIHWLGSSAPPAQPSEAPR